MASGQRRPDAVVHHSVKGSQYTSLAFGKRCREMGVVTSTGTAADRLPQCGWRKLIPVHGNGVTPVDGGDAERRLWYARQGAVLVYVADMLEFLKVSPGEAVLEACAAALVALSAHVSGYEELLRSLPS